ncbi:glycosyltransferase [Planktomarina temperata]|nr:glycosyltransferase [bacterium]MDB2458911.1 glycosyltransferase [Planktomarina temperata]
MSNTSKRLSVLVSAHEISPVLGSECSSAWNILTRLGKYHDILVLHAETNQFGTNHYRNEIVKHLDNEKLDFVQFISIPQPKLTRVIARLNRILSPVKTSVGIPPLYFLGVYFWEKAVFRQAKTLMETTHFDLIHHFNHLSYREPGLLYKIRLPFVWGPVSGAFSLPMPFIEDRPLGFRIKYILRNTLNRFRSRFSARITAAARNASLILYVTPADKLFFEAKKCLNIKPCLDVGAKTQTKSDVCPTKLRIAPIDDLLRVLWVGRLDHLKALDLLLKALEKDDVLLSKVHLTIVGDGELSNYLHKLARDKGIYNIFWAGAVTNAEVFHFMQSADVLVHTSVKEAGSAVVMEALSEGLPVICHDAFGFSYTITDRCGIKIPFKNPHESIKGFNQALRLCLRDRELLQSLKIGAKERASNISWDQLAKSIAADYIKIFEDDKYLNKNSRW